MRVGRESPVQRPLVGHRLMAELHQALAFVREAGTTCIAGTAVDRDAPDNSIADRQGLTVDGGRGLVAEVDDAPNLLVPKHQRGRRRPVPGDRMQIRAADCCKLDRDEHLTRTERD